MVSGTVCHDYLTRYSTVADTMIRHIAHESGSIPTRTRRIATETKESARAPQTTTTMLARRAKRLTREKQDNRLGRSDDGNYYDLLRVLQPGKAIERQEQET